MWKSVTGYRHTTTIRTLWLIALSGFPLFGKLCFAETDTLRIAAYNLLFFDGSQDASGRVPAFHTVLTALNPDILVVCEMDNQYALDLFHLTVLGRGNYDRTSYTESPDRDVVCFYRRGWFESVSTEVVPTAHRDIVTFGLRYLKAVGSPVLYVTGVHLKAGDQFADDRTLEAQAYADSITVHHGDDYVLMCGDLNLYSNLEGAYTVLLKDSLFNDPLNAFAPWHHNRAYAYLHTQSTRFEFVSNGSGAGLDDRFDFILASRSFFHASDAGWSIVTGSYQAYGEDGKHFAQSVFSPERPNAAVPQEVAQALYDASDHLPVTARLVVKWNKEAVRGQSDGVQPQGWFKAFPNPGNGEIELSFTVGKPSDCKLAVYDLYGRVVASLLSRRITAGDHSFVWRTDRVASGVYLALLTVGGARKFHKLTVVK